MRTLTLIIFAVALVGCIGAPHVEQRLHENRGLFRQDFRPRGPGSEVEIWVGETDRDKIALAVIRSDSSAERTREAREMQLEQLRETARRLGAHAVENVRVETTEVRGFVADPRVPFTAVKQGEYELYFIRGTAIRYIDGDVSP